MTKQRFGFLLFNGLEELDLVGPWEMIKIWGKEFSGPDEIFTISEHGNAVTCIKELQISADHSFASCPKLDYLLVPGGRGTRTEVNNPPLIGFIRQQAEHCQTILSVCTGAFLLQAAGLLSGKKATTYWSALDRLRQFPDIEVCEQRYVADGAIWTSAGISAGIDMSLAFIAATAGKDVAGKVQLYAEYFPEDKRYLDWDCADTENLPAYLKVT